MTNQEYLNTLTPEECYDKMWWLFIVYGRAFNDSRQAVIQWLKEEVDD